MIITREKKRIEEKNKNKNNEKRNKRNVYRVFELSQNLQRYKNRFLALSLQKFHQLIFF